jgi:hypothetical protein
LSLTNPEGFPWGTNTPTRRARAFFALLVALAAGGGLYGHYVKFPQTRSDFTQARFGARAIVHGADPYKLVGPNKVFESQYPVMYPATAFVAAIPFILVRDQVASALFIVISTFLLAYGSTRGSWHRTPMFVSMAFASSVQLAQWNILTTAMLFLPWLAVFTAVKPQSALPILITSPSRTSIVAALIGGAVLFAASLLLLPGWPVEWWHILRGGQQMVAPVKRLGGVVVLLALVRWRRPEVWLIVLTAITPQSWAWYNVLVLLAIPATYREAAALSLASSFGALAVGLSAQNWISPERDWVWGAAMMAFAYLPATIVVLRRPNVHETPSWKSTGELQRLVPQRTGIQ